RFYSLDCVTTALELELGTTDVAAWYRERSAAELANYGVSIGHIKARMAVMHDSGTWMPVSDGAYRAATPAEIGEIAQRLEIGLHEGAVDIGAGFPYTPAATRDELLAVFRVAARTKTPIHVHIRPGVGGLNEALSLAGETSAPLHVVHINSAGLADTPVMLEIISDARAHVRDVTTEAYPYAAEMTEIQSATIQDTYRAAPDERLAELEWPRTGERLNRESFERYSRVGGPVVVHTNTEQMVAVAIHSPLTMIASDAYWQRGTGHPRTTGTFARVLGRFVREADRPPSPNGRGGGGAVSRGHRGGKGSPGPKMTDPSAPSRRDFLVASAIGFIGLAGGSERPALRDVAQTESDLLYVGTYTAGTRSEGIYLIRMD